MEESTKLLFLNNLFSILSAEKGANLNRKKSIIDAKNELTLVNDELTRAVSEWNSNGRQLRFSTDQEENILLFSYMAASLLCEDNLHDDSVALFYIFSEKIGVPQTVASEVLKGRERFNSVQEFSEKTGLIHKAVREGSLRSRKNSRKEPVDSKDFYIANQVSPEGLDELQRLLLAAHLDLHTAIDGPPGVGKTRSVIEVSRILGKNLFTKTCSSRTTESHIISSPVLAVENGASVSRHINGPLVLAMEEGAIFYGDEFNLLKEDVQKRLNSAFDERRYIDRNDGMQVAASQGFWGVISYNPTRNMIARDLEDSVADRFIHFHYKRWSPDFKACVSSGRAMGMDPLSSDNSASFNISLEWRGVSTGLKFFRGMVISGRTEWYDFFTGKKSDEQPEYIYRVYDRGSILKDLTSDKMKELASLAKNSFSEIELARIIARFTDMLHSLSTTGKSTLLKKIGLGNIIEEEDLELLMLHESSARIEMAALRHYHELLARGFNRYLAQTYAARLVIDQVCYGQYREKRLRNTTVYSLVLRIASAMRLLTENSRYNTSFDASGFLAN